MSLIGALTPLGKVARHMWLKNVSAFTIAGILTSCVVGAALSGVGAATPVGSSSAVAIGVVVAVGGLTAARELGWWSWTVPQLRRQTRGAWAKRFHPTVASALWGLDLGLTFTTWLTFSGIWLLCVVVFVLGDVAFGALLFVTYWLGRAASVWAGPILLAAPSRTPELLEEIANNYHVVKRVHIVGIAFLTVMSWAYLVGSGAS